MRPPLAAPAGLLLIRVGEEAFIYSSLASFNLEGYARSRDVAYEISPLLSFGGVALDANDLAASLVQMVATGDQGVDPAPIALPAGCPAVDSPLVTDLVGPVVVARGGELPGLPPMCSYLGEGARTVRAQGAILPGTTFEREYASDALGDAVEALDPRPGPTLDYYRNDQGGRSVWAMYPQAALHVDITANEGDRAALVRFARAHLKDHAPE